MKLLNTSTIHIVLHTFLSLQNILAFSTSICCFVLYIDHFSLSEVHINLIPPLFSWTPSFSQPIHTFFIDLLSNSFGMINSMFVPNPRLLHTHFFLTWFLLLLLHFFKNIPIPFILFLCFFYVSSYIKSTLTSIYTNRQKYAIMPSQFYFSEHIPSLQETIYYLSTYISSSQNFSIHSKYMTNSAK